MKGFTVRSKQSELSPHCSRPYRLVPKQVKLPKRIEPNVKNLELGRQQLIQYPLHRSLGATMHGNLDLCLCP